MPRVPAPPSPSPPPPGWRALGAAAGWLVASGSLLLGYSIVSGLTGRALDDDLSIVVLLGHGLLGLAGGAGLGRRGAPPEPAAAPAPPAQSYAQPAQLFRGGASGGRLQEVPASLLGALPGPWVGRGLAAADIDGDGDLDLALGQAGGPVVLLRNERPPGAHRLRLRLRGRGPNPRALGAQVTLAAAGRVQARAQVPTRSYWSQCEDVLSFGLGAATQVERVEIRWPSGHRQVERDLPVDRTMTLHEPASPGALR